VVYSLCSVLFGNTSCGSSKSSETISDAFSRKDTGIIDEDVQRKDWLDSVIETLGGRGRQASKVLLGS